MSKLVSKANSSAKINILDADDPPPEGHDQKDHKYAYNLKQTPDRDTNPVKRLAKLKRILNKIQNNIEVEVEPSCLVLDPLWYTDPAYSVLFFFLEMSEYEGYENTIDLAYLNALFERGADIKVTDKLGQNILHDCARIHKVNTARYFIRSGADINKQDIYGRTPLHIAAKCDYADMVKLFIASGAQLEIVTNGACYTALHCAAMGDAAETIETLLEAGSDKEKSDYRGRTPLLIAAEFDRRSASAKLIEMGASARVVDYTGLHALSLLIARMPKLAAEALNQCIDLDKKSRELKVWLNYMEPDLQVPKDARYGFSLIDEVSKSGDSDLVQHPAVKALISAKWKQFGQRAIIKDIGLYVIYLLSWSLLMILTPLIPPSKTVPNSDSRGTQRMITEATAYIFYIIFVLDEISEARLGNIQQRKWVNMRIGQVQSDLKVLRPLSDMDRQYMEGEIEKSLKTKSLYFKDYWNVYDWVCYGLQFMSIIVYIYCEVTAAGIDVNDDKERKSYFKIFGIRSQLMSIAMMLSWFKMFKYVRVFKSLGPFVVIITHSIGDIAKIAFVYLLLYIPMVCVFYQFYGARDIKGYLDVQDVMFTVFRMIVVDDYNYNGLLGADVITEAEEKEEEASTDVASRMRRKANYNTETTTRKVVSEVSVDQWWTRCIVAYWIIVSSVILLNLFIALMSDTFQRVYDNAVGVAALETADTISGLEGKLTKKSRDRFLNDLNENYSPIVQFLALSEADDDGNSDELKKLDELEQKISKLMANVEAANEQLKNDLYDMQQGHMKILTNLDNKVTEMYLRDHGRTT